LLPLSLYTYAFRYCGSKTSGNLASGVEWIILTTPIEFSREQLNILEPIKSIGTRIHPSNNRDVHLEHVAIS
ncbi:MAG: carbonic anhydrase family protein, partial [bacterium]|nr:carbonic anhydrase family protein [bacterium]